MRHVMFSMQAATDADAWSGTEAAIRFGFPLAVVVVGLIVFLGGRSERRALRADATQQGGFGGPPGTTDVGSVEGFDRDQYRAEVLAASRKVLTGLFIMLGGSLTLFGVTLWRLLS